jgi:hypothetical protein
MELMRPHRSRALVKIFEECSLKNDRFLGWELRASEKAIATLDKKSKLSIDDGISRWNQPIY